MDATTLLVTVYCLIDDWLAGRRVRRRGPQPVLSDSEVLTIECVGEFLGIDTDKGLYEHFRRHSGDWFPALGRLHRPTFVRQAANLWAVKAQLRQQLLTQVHFDPAISMLDSFPCRSAASVAPIAASGWPSWPASAATRRQADLLWAPSPSAGLLARSDHRRPAGPGQPAGVAVALSQATGAAPAELGTPAPPADRDGDRPAGRALPRQTGLGPRCLASMVTLATQAAQPHPGRPSLPTARPRPAPVRRPGHQLKPAHRLANP